MDAALDVEVIDRRGRFAVCLLLVAVGLFAAPAVRAQQAPRPIAADLPLEAFFRNPSYSRATLSPDGRYLAALRPVDGRVNIVVLDLDTGQGNVVTRFPLVDVATVSWVTNDHLTYRLADFEKGVAEGVTRMIRRDGKEPRSFYGSGMISWPESGSTRMVMVDHGRSRQSLDARRYDVATGTDVLLTQSLPARMRAYVADRNADVRIGLAMEDKKTVTAFHRIDMDHPWEPLFSYAAERDAIVPLTFDDDGSLLVMAYAGHDTKGLYRYDLATKTLAAEPLLFHPGHDFEGTLLRNRTGKVVGAVLEADRTETFWFDELHARTQAVVDRALPDHRNEIQIAGKRALVYSESDVDPGAYYLLDMDSHRMEMLSRSRPWIEPARMSPVRMIRYRARDGLDIPAALVLPQGLPEKHLPLIVSVHGGPWLRDAHWQWQPEQQFYASRGYAVLNADFRGSTGYGLKHYQAGFRQWGLAMQDDLTDGVRSLVDRGIVDPDRVCIVGGSYGGYAAVWGVAKDPTLYRCAVDMFGVADPDHMFSVGWSDFAYSDWYDYRLADLLGDPSKDRAMFDSVSPIVHAKNIRVPVLMAYGVKDRRVPITHGKDLRSALEGAGVTVEWLVYANAPHGFIREEDRFDFFRRVDTFLKANLEAPIKGGS